MIKTRVTAGDAPEWDLIKFQASKVQFERDLVTARLLSQQAVRDVLTFVGAAWSAADAPLEVVGELRVEPPTVALSLAELRQAALDARPDVLAAQRSVEAARRTLDLAYAQRHRDIDVALEYQRVGSDNTIGATVSFPLFCPISLRARSTRDWPRSSKRRSPSSKPSYRRSRRWRKPTRPIGEPTVLRSIPRKPWRKLKPRCASRASPIARAPRVCGTAGGPAHPQPDARGGQ